VTFDATSAEGDAPALPRAEPNSIPKSCAAGSVEQRLEGVTAIELPGEFSTHGGSSTSSRYADSDPMRVEFFGDETNRSAGSTFDDAAEDRRSAERRSSTVVRPVGSQFRRQNEE